MQKINFFTSLLISLLSINLFAQSPLYPEGIIEQFCNTYAEGMSTSDLQYDNIFFDKYKCTSVVNGNIFGENNLDAAAIFEETFSGDGYRFGVVFRSDGKSTLFPEAFVFDLFSALESGSSGGCYFNLESGQPLTLVKMWGSSSGEIHTYEYDYNYDWGRLELVKETFEEYDKFSENQSNPKVIYYDYWERPGMRTCLGEFYVSDEQYQAYIIIVQNYQACLDQGQFMLGCAQEKYDVTDKLLNEEYQALRKLLNSHQKDELRIKQLEWLNKRDNYFASIEEEIINSGIGGNDAQMMIWDKKAEFVINRVIELMESQTKLQD